MSRIKTYKSQEYIKPLNRDIVRIAENVGFYVEELYTSHVRIDESKHVNQSIEYDFWFGDNLPPTLCFMKRSSIHRKSEYTINLFTMKPTFLSPIKTPIPDEILSRIKSDYYKIHPNGNLSWSAMNLS